LRRFDARAISAVRYYRNGSPVLVSRREVASRQNPGDALDRRPGRRSKTRIVATRLANAATVIHSPGRHGCRSPVLQAEAKFRMTVASQVCLDTAAAVETASDDFCLEIIDRTQQSQASLASSRLRQRLAVLAGTRARRQVFRPYVGPGASLSGRDRAWHKPLLQLLSAMTPPRSPWAFARSASACGSSRATS
jgi:hypothetical protein